MEQERDGQVVYVKDLLFAAMYAWRGLLVAALLFALVLGLYRGVKPYTPVGEVSSEAIEEYREQYDALTQEAERLQTRVDRQTAYLESSVLMSLDPYNVYQGEMDVFIQTEPDALETDAAVIAAAYTKSLTRLAGLQQIAQSLDIEETYLAELISVTSTAASPGFFTVTVVYGSEKGASDILAQIRQYLPVLEGEIAASVRPHTVQPVSESVRITVRMDLVQQQENALSQLRQLEKSLTETQEALEALVNPEEEMTTGGGLAHRVKGILKYAILGGFLGLFLGVAWVCLRHILGNTVYSARTLLGHTGVRVLGRVAAPNRRRRGIDRWLRKLEGRARDAQTEENWALITANIRNYAAGVKKLLVTGSCGQEDIAALRTALEKAGIPAVSAGSLLSDPQALSALPECDGVLLVERCGVSRYRNICQQVQTVQDMKKPLLGCVLLDG